MGLSAADLRAGVRDAAPLFLGIGPFGLVAGVAAVEQGLSVPHAVGFSVVVFAGASQLAMVELLGKNAPLAVVVGTAVVVNLRMLMYSASLAPSVQSFDARRKVVTAYLLTDQAYALAVARFGSGGDVDRFAYYLGAGGSVWLVWQVATVAGALLGSELPPAWGLEFAAPLVFLALLVPAVKDRPAAAAALVGGTVSVAAAGVPFDLNLVVAAVAGIAAGVAAESAGGTD